MRTLVLVMLWLMVGGFGLMTLCSGAFAFMAPMIALPIGLVAGGLTWICWTSLRGLKDRRPLSQGADSDSVSDSDSDSESDGDGDDPPA
jgi:hypothetical protein